MISCIRISYVISAGVNVLPRRTSNIGSRLSASFASKYTSINAISSQIRNLGIGPTSKDFQEKTTHTGPLTTLHANELVIRLTIEERKILFTALQEFESKRIKQSYEGRLASQRWRTTLGRPSQFTSLGDVDPTGTYCPMPEDWLQKKFAETTPKPTTKELFHLLFANSIPFVGFGFLDNFIMLVAGDSIESSMSSYITLSTMAAAALGNTLSDVIGIGSSVYVERAAALIGLGAPKLTPIQLEMPITRRFANLGRVIGITVGCFLGMIPLLFRDEKAEER